MLARGCIRRTAVDEPRKFTAKSGAAFFAFLLRHLVYGAAGGYATPAPAYLLIIFLTIVSPPPQQQQQQAAQQSSQQQQPAPQKPNGLPPLMLVSAVLEFFGGLLFLLGLFTRPVAFLLSGELAVAYFMAHAPRGFWPLLNQGDLAALYSFLFLYFAVAGGGEWSVDRLWRRDRPTRDAVA